MSDDRARDLKQLAEHLDAAAQLADHLGLADAARLYPMRTLAWIARHKAPLEEIRDTPPATNPTPSSEHSPLPAKEDK